MSRKPERDEASGRGVEYWVTCALDPWPALEGDEAFAEIVDALRSEGEYEYDAVTLTLLDSGPAFVPPGSVVVHVSGRAGANWDEVMELLDAMAEGGDGVVFSEDRQVVLDRRALRSGGAAFDERPAWATELAARWPQLSVIVIGTRAVADPVEALHHVGLGTLATRVQIDAIDNGLAIRGPSVIDALVAGQALCHVANGQAFAIGPDNQRELLPR